MSAVTALNVDELAGIIGPSIVRNSRAAHRMFGTVRPVAIANYIHDYCVAGLGSLPAEVFFVGISAGFVFGLRLADGREAAIKLHDTESFEHLSRAYTIQEQLRLRGIACARLILPPSEILPGRYAVAHNFSASGCEPGMSPRVRRIIVREYVRMLDVARGLDCTGLAHNEFPLNAAVRDHIPGLKENLEDVSRDRSDVVAHGDWKIRNLLFEHDEVAAVFDFNSLRLQPELYGVAETSISFMNKRGRLSITLFPEQTHAFMLDYERVRGNPFSQAEVRRLRIWTLAALVLKTSLRPHRGVPAAILAERINNFDREIGQLWNAWAQ